MPREVIYDQCEQFDTVIRWDAIGNDNDVQVGIASRDGRPLAEHLKESDGAPAPFSSVWGTLDRRSVNRLIQLLRRARNQTFGVDE